VTSATTVLAADLSSSTPPSSSVFGHTGCSISLVTLDFFNLGSQVGLLLCPGFGTTLINSDKFSLADYSTPGTYTVTTGGSSTHW
jgi:hypothetical protein